MLLVYNSRVLRFVYHHPERPVFSDDVGRSRVCRAQVLPGGLVCLVKVVSP